MTSLYIIFGLAMVVDACVAYLAIGLALAEFKGIYLPLFKRGKKRKCTNTLTPKNVSYLASCREYLAWEIFME